jgi:hypothetical protein
MLLYLLLLIDWCCMTGGDGRGMSENGGVSERLAKKGLNLKLDEIGDYFTSTNL